MQNERTVPPKESRRQQEHLLFTFGAKLPDLYKNRKIIRKLRKKKFEKTTITARDLSLLAFTCNLSPLALYTIHRHKPCFNPNMEK